jgi:two-component system aerobic respiration control sensor histidine kinase ArcB
LLSDSINSLSALAREKAIGLEFWFDPKLPTELRTDAGRLRQVINNLVGNAIKHIERGTVTVSAFLSHHDEQGNALRLEIADTGPGIEADKLRALFASADTNADADPNIDAAIAAQPVLGGPRSMIGRKQESSGLGLAITQQLVHQLDGDLTVLGTVGSGTTICVTLPLNEPPAGEQKTAGNAIEPTRPVTPNACVLLVDDDRLSRVMLAALLEERGYQVLQAEDGEQALQEFCRESVDLVISDMCMPGISGAELARKIRVIEKLGNARPTPLVALTGLVDDSVTQDLLRDGFNETLTKPILIDSLMRVLNSQLNPVASMH